MSANQCNPFCTLSSIHSIVGFQLKTKCFIIILLEWLRQNITRYGPCHLDGYILNIKEGESRKQNVTVSLGEQNISITCPVCSSGQHGDKDVHWNFTKRNQRETVKVSVNVKTLIIETIKNENIGTYICHAGGASYTTELTQTGKGGGAPVGLSTNLSFSKSHIM